MRKIIFILLTITLPFASLQLKAQTDVETKKLSFHDKFAYKTAVAMYAVADTLPYSTVADQLIRDISAKLDQGVAIENDAIWSNLQKLEPYRMNPRVQEAARVWVERSVKKISSQTGSRQATLSSLQTVSTAYNSGDFYRAVQECKNILSATPKHFDIRSNMALALMHMNKDLCAQIELEIVTQLSTTHIPAMMNLTVVYERMNRRRDAENLASRVSQFSVNNKLDVPAIRYNTAWYQFQNGDIKSAETLGNRP